MPTVTTKKGIEHSVTAASQLESSWLKTSTVEKDKQGNVPKSNLPGESKMEKKGGVFSMVDCGLLGDKCMNGIEPAASKNTTTCAPDVTSHAEFLVGSNFVTPRKNKLAEVTAHIGSAETLKTKSTLNSKGQSCGSGARKNPGSYSKSDLNKKSAPSSNSVKIQVGENIENLGGTHTCSCSHWPPAGCLAH